VTVSGTQSEVWLVDEVRSVRAGDGLHLVRSEGALRSISLENNERVGLLVELGGASTDLLDLQSVEVSGSGEQLGAVAQGGTVEPAWDEQVERQGATTANDTAFEGTLAIAEAVGPSCLPAPDALAGDLSGLLGP
jgi:hypothetical protein